MLELIKKYVGKTVIVRLGGLDVEVTVTDVKERWGRTRYFITPVAGSGEAWVETITLKDEVRV